MTAIDEDDQHDMLHGIWNGVVVNVSDPLGIGRVRVEIPGLVEPESAWALPLTVGGGSPQRGHWDVPPVGSDVYVMFHQGDVDHPLYIGGHWGNPKAGTEVPTAVKAVPVAERPRLQAIEGPRYMFVMDNRPGKERCYFLDKLSGDTVLMDSLAGITVQTTKTVHVKATGDVNVEAGGAAHVTAAGDVSIDGRAVKLNGGGEPVARTTDAIMGQIPPGIVMVPNPVDGSPIPSPFPIDVPGVITGGSPGGVRSS